MPDTNNIVFLVTGASRGLGRAIALTSAKYYLTKYNDDSQSILQLYYILVARSASGLEELKDKLENISTSDNVRISAHCHIVDLGNLDDLDANLDKILKDVDSFTSDESSGDQHNIFFINNAGSLGHLGPCTTSPSLQDMRQTLDLNVTSCLWSSVKVAQHIKRKQEQRSTNSTLNAVLVNISSLVAISDDFVTMGIYSAGKGAREKYHTLLAKEEQQTSLDQWTTIKTLNYAPGPLETDMTTSLRNSESLDSNLQKNFDKQLLNVNDSAWKLIRLLDSNDFDSGAHVDYFDLPDSPPSRPCGCDTFVAFPPATPPGIIVFGKNSDRPTGEGQSIRRYPQKKYPPGSKVKCTYIEIDQVETTHAVLLSQIDWMFGAEMGSNEKGVVIGNEAIWTRDECQSEPKYLLGMDLVRLGLERGETAVHALNVITELLEKHGQGGPCAEDDPSFCYHNSYLILDGSEAWVLETSGRHWVAQRITKGVRNISNCMSIRSDFDLCSDNVCHHATEQGYWRESYGPLDFAAAFSTCGNAETEMSDQRFCGGRKLLEKYSNKGTMTKEAMMEILRDHKSGICMHGGGFETTSAWVSEFTTNGKDTNVRHFVTGGPHPCKKAFREESII
ncbi:peptidase C69 family protein [Nitzschia inconspicua]|uniref:Peptidase C69 family protein n=1 Tax=Nitzschia inconspicua TaxID=303405 RepID=A0A9K3PRH6_9STRA|nr:peptidase C69 family protein [Nitzschia inconspicua]